MNRVFYPMDEVIWKFRKRGKPYIAQFVQATVWYLTPKHVAIRFKDRLNQEIVKFVPRKQLEKV